MKRSFRSRMILENARNKPSATVVLRENGAREFFRYEKGELIMYEKTQHNGNPIELTPEEEEGMNEFFSTVSGS